MIPTVDAAIARIRAFALVQAWPPARFAREAGLSVNALREFANADWSPSVSTLQKLEAVIPAEFVGVSASSESSEAAA